MTTISDCSGCANWAAVGTIGGRPCGRCSAARSFHEDGVLLSYCTPAAFRCGNWVAANRNYPSTSLRACSTSSV